MAMNAKRTAGIAVVLAFLSAVPLANAQPASPSTWNGGYLGIETGLGLGTDNSSQSCVEPTTGNTGYSMTSGWYCQHLNPGQSAFNIPTGNFAGLTAGYNMQSGPAVLGVEANFALAALNDHQAVSGTYYNYGWDNGPAPHSIRLGHSAGDSTTDQSFNDLTTLKARFGILPAQSILVYVTGGLAAAQVNSQGTFDTYNFGTSSWATFKGADQSFKLGFIVGAGVEAALSKHFSIKV